MRVSRREIVRGLAAAAALAGAGGAATAQAPAKLLLSPSGRHSNFEPAEVPVPVHAMAGAERGDVSRPIAEPFGSEPSETRVIEPVVGGPTPWEPTEEPRRAPSVELPALSASSAEPRFSGPLSSSSEVHSAKQQAQQIVTLAQREAQEMRIAAERYADQVLAQLETEVSRALQTVRNGRAFLQSKRRKQQENN